MVAVHPGSVASHIDRVLAHSIGHAAAVYGYPMVEMLRLCRLQTCSRVDPPDDPRAPMGVFFRWAGPSGGAGAPRALRPCAAAWLYLGDEPCRLPRPAAAPSGPRLLRLYDGYAENFACLRLDTGAAAATVLIGPRAPLPALAEGEQVLRARTRLVWVHYHAADAQPAMPGLRTPSAPSARAWRPPAVDLWAGGPHDALRTIADDRAAAPALAPAYFVNLCQALAQTPGLPQDEGLRQQFRRAGLCPGPMEAWHALPAVTRRGLADGLADAAQCVRNAAHSQPDGAATRLRPYVLRAARAARGIGMPEDPETLPTHAA